MGTSPTAAVDRPPVIVVGLDCITGLQTARILHGHGIAVVGVASDRRHFCARTRACTEVVEADTTGPSLIDALERLARRPGPPPVVIPCTDGAVWRLSLDRDRLDGLVRVGLPAHQTVELLTSKVGLARFGRDHGFRVPATFEVRSPADLDAAASSTRFPCVIKPAVKDARWVAATSQKAALVPDAGTLRSLYATWSAWSDTFVVQEWIEGPETELYSCNCYIGADGSALATFVARKVRQWPPDTGTSALGVECREDTVLHETIRLFATVGYHGLGYVEMKRDARDGELYLVEPNIGRPTGRSAIAEAGGVELLHTAYCELAGLPLPTERTQHYGDAKWIYLRHDLQAAVHRWRTGELGVGEWWRSLRGPRAEAVGSLSDPVPFVLDTAGAVRTAATRLARRLRPSRTGGTAPAPPIATGS